ncbi:winged helix-turn-helix transcriptional regulator [Govanella unica]|uniref:Helix-turn-helix transcriptional regulator n=1 Tax=Govanella unica TaxID=2975056 RepID=A0A9X3Z883_9PROT|nr:helix-turn-helix domain-containing protein [Govania unica]MDA5194764.1 helix-turn-helix transcriptional regulator [Govania unica]
MGTGSDKAVKEIRACSIWRALELVGDLPTNLILEASFLGVRRFEEFCARTNVLRTLVTSRLKKLTEEGCLDRVQYSTRPPRYEYRLTVKGRALYHNSLMMLRWERKWGRGQGKMTVTLTHNLCGHEFTPEMQCQSCHKDIDPRAVTWKEGPGLAMMPLEYGRRRRQSSSAVARQGPTSLFDDIAQIIGDRSAMLVLRACFTGKQRFEDIREDAQIATNILSDRLKWLVEEEVLRRELYQESPARYRYRLAEKGLDIYPILLELLRWGDGWYALPEGPPLLLFHKPDGHPLNPAVVCSHCKAEIKITEVSFTVTERD